MARRGSIDRLAPEFIRLIDSGRAEGWLIDEILAALEAAGAPKVSRSALARHTKRLDADRVRVKPLALMLAALARDVLPGRERERACARLALMLTEPEPMSIRELELAALVALLSTKAAE